MYKDPAEVIIDEESDLANVGEECLYCTSTDGFKIVGQIDDYEEETTEKDSEESTEKDSEESEDDIIDVKVDDVEYKIVSIKDCLAILS